MENILSNINKIYPKKIICIFDQFIDINYQYNILLILNQNFNNIIFETMINDKKLNNVYIYILKFIEQYIDYMCYYSFAVFMQLWRIIMILNSLNLILIVLLILQNTRYIIKYYIILYYII